MIEIKYDAKECPLYIGNTCHALDKAYRVGRADAIDEIYDKVLNLCNELIRIHNHDFDSAKSEQYKYDLNRDARTMHRDFNMTLDLIKEIKEQNSNSNSK